MNMNSIIDIALIANGIYDLLCASSILWLYKIPVFTQLSKLHPMMFEKKENYDNPVIKRLLSYWLITEGSIRIIAGCYRNIGLDIAASFTYFIEAFCFEYENRIGLTMVRSKVMFVSIVSTIMGIWILLRPFGIYDKINI